MSIWSRWFSNKTHSKIESVDVPVIAAVTQPVISAVTLPVNWPISDDNAVIQTWFLMWQQSREQAQQWLLEQKQTAPEKLQIWAAQAIILAPNNDSRQCLLDLISDAEILKSLLIVFKQKDKSIYKRLKTLLAPEVVVNVNVPTIVQAVQVSVREIPEETIPAIEMDNTDYVACAQLCQQTLNLYQAFTELSVNHLSQLKILLAQQQVVQQRAAQTLNPTPEQLRFLQDYERLLQLTDAVKRWLICVDELQQLCQPIKETASVPQLQKNVTRLQNIVEQLDWPLAGDRLTLLTQAKKQLKQLALQIELLQQQLAQTEQTWQQQFPLLEQSLQAGDLSKAESVLKILQRLSLNANQKQQLQNLSQRLYELKDWQGFAELPKKQQLIEAMQQIVNVPLPPESQAERIKYLQAQWQVLNASEHHALWQQFKNLADVAYQPCQQFYAQQKQQRLDNVKIREQLCEQLEQYIAEHDWAKADWIKVKQTQQIAKQSWRTAFPVERAMMSELQNRFDKVMQLLNSKQDEHRRQQVQARQQLIVERQRRQQVREEKAKKHQQQLELAAQKKQQEIDRQEKIKAQKFAQQQQRQQLEQQYYQRLENHMGGELTTPTDDQHKQRLVIQLEILAGLSSPEAEQALRMQVQVERLAKNFQATESTLAPHHAIVEQWCNLLPLTSATQHEDFAKRMLAAYQHYISAIR